MNIELVSTPIWWIVDLTNNSTVRIFADSYSELADDIVFYVQYKVGDGLDINFTVDETSTSGDWVMVRVAEFASEDVRSVLTAS